MTAAVIGPPPQWQPSPLVPDCTGTSACPSVTGHWWACLSGRAGWRRDNYTSTVAAAAAHAGVNRDARHEHGDPRDDPPTRGET